MMLEHGTDPQGIIDAFEMIPHPEGGWYSERFRAPQAAGARPVVSSIYFLLRAGERSHWHTVDAVEIWLWHAGASVRLHISSDGQSTESVLVGPDVAAGEQLHAVVPEGAWQSAESTGAWSLVSCVVAPAFEFAGFTIAPDGWSPGG